MITIVDICNAGLFAAIAITLVSPQIPGLRSVSRYGKTLKTVQRFNYYLPKRYFAHFYVIATALPVFLSLLLLSDIPVVEYIASVDWVSRDHQRTLSRSKALFALLLNSLQGSRRLYESVHVFRPLPDAKIQLLHYLIGCVYYLIVDMQLVACMDPLNNSPLPLLESSIFALLFFVVYLDQARHHAHLSGLKKYTIPSQGLFRYVAGAHYFDEILLYALQFWYLRTETSLAVAAYVAVSLSVVAANSHEYYKEKDASYSVNHKVVIPFLY
ncbi:unnamed protein product [Kuraishia capsulata CBS 1993]|uniref:Polyprenal reductase n=1 Tax=Kuraishia capsulata CBS 1993 TaxID=1382522 RepID=W6MRK4_9ASCO|nr:uncharacterized protein KUCA_T00003857001 [Kuraishia capsulata CBS 1993]CDK27877.1 unnamed protein product [Kuraishia capsulata CBS 1993]